MQDLIERRAALTALCEDCLRKHDGICPHPASRCVEFRTIKQLPAIEAKPVRHGRWDYRHEDDWCYCSVCGTDAEGSDGECLETDYCPHCGARMDSGPLPTPFTLGSEANGCWISCAECANTGCKNRYVQEAKEDDKR